MFEKNIYFKKCILLMFVNLTFAFQYTGMDGSHFQEHPEDVVRKLIYVYHNRR